MEDMADSNEVWLPQLEERMRDCCESIDCTLSRLLSDVPAMDELNEASLLFDSLRGRAYMPVWLDGGPSV